MPTYAFEAMNSSGQEVKDEIDASTSEEAIAKIRQKGFFPTKVREKAGKKKVGKKKEEVTSGSTRKMPISIAVGIVSMIIIFVIPKFEQIFKDFKVNLPDVTKALLIVSRWFANDYGWAYVIAFPFIFIAILKLARMSEGGKYAVDIVKLKIPILGGIVSKSVIARFTRTLGTLISAGVPILDAINITKETCRNEVYARALVKVHDTIREGESMADPLRATKVCDAIVVNMVDVGEETGDLDKMLLKVADNYDSDVDVLVGSLISILEPVMVVVLGLIVGFIVIALFMPMITLIGAVSGTKSK